MQAFTVSCTIFDCAQEDDKEYQNKKEAEESIGPECCPILDSDPNIID